MNRVLVALLTVFDAALAAAVGLAIVLAPLSALWVLGFGGGADWAALWPASVTVWQLGHFVPLAITLPDAYLAVTGIDASAAAFVVSLAPSALALFTAVFAARSGARAARSGAWATGVVSSGVVFAVLAALAALTGGTTLAAVDLWKAILFPALVFVVPALVAALVVEWREAEDGLVARVRDRVETRAGGWGEVPGLAVRGTAVAVTGLVGIGSLALAVAVVAGGADVVALFQAGHMDVLDVVVTSLAQLAFLPALVVWALAFAAGPGFALGTASSVSPVGTQLGVLPGIPVLGAVPELQSPWFLLVALLPVAAGGLAGWVVRSRLVAAAEAAPATAAPAPTVPWAVPALQGLIGDPRDAAAPEPDDAHDDGFGVRLALTALIAVLSGALTGLLAALASGSIGPGRLAEVGPAPGPVALAVGLEVFVGAAILLLSPRRRAPVSRAHAPEGGSRDGGAEPRDGDRGERGTDAVPAVRWTGEAGAPGAAAGEAPTSRRTPDIDVAGTDADAAPAPAPADAGDGDTAPLPPFVPREREDGASAPRRPSPLPPVD